MSITRKDINEVLGEVKLEDDVMRKLMALIHSETDAIKDERDAIQNKLTTAENDLKAANDAKDKAEHDFTAYKEAQTKAQTISAKKEAYSKLLNEIGISGKSAELILKGIDTDTFEIEDGKVKDADTLSESLKNEYADFIVQREVHGADVKKPPVGGAPVDFSKMTDAEYFAYQRNLKKGN